MFINSLLFLSAKISVGNGALIALVGFSLVVAVLIILIFIFKFIGYVFKRIDERPQSNNADAITESNAQNTVNDEEIVAAITAAIALVMQSELSESEPPPFIIRNITQL